MFKVPEIDNFLTHCIAEGDFSSAVYLVGTPGKVYFEGACGLAVATPANISATLETIYDLASLTKPLVTTLLLTQLIEAREISPQDPISHYLPLFDTPDKRTITIAQLASHCSGLPKWLPFYALIDAETPVIARLTKVVELIAQQPLANPTGTKVAYSDLNFLTLSLLLTTLTGKPLDILAHQNIIQPLGLTHTCFQPPAEWQPQIAASEVGNQYERKIAGKQAANYQQWRTKLIWGEVHDHNAYFLGGVAGHAGLFSPVKEVYKLAQQFLPGSKLFSDSILSYFAQNLTPQYEQGSSFDYFAENLTHQSEQSRSFGWQLSITRINTDATLPISFGHVGFTGTSLWLVPAHQQIFILLTNCTHPTYPEANYYNMNKRRRHFHLLAQEAIAQHG